MKTWENAERKLSRKIGGRRSPGSGNGYWEGDIRNPTILVEMKETSKEYMTLQTIWFPKIVDEAIRNRRLPVLGIEFGDGTQIYFVREKDVDVGINKIHTWIGKSTVRLRPGNLEEEDIVITDYGKWRIIGISVLKDLSKE
jgi:hypothetical protein